MGSIVKILIFLPFVLILAYLSIKVGGSRMMGISGSKVIRIVEKVPLSNKTFLCVAIINGKAFVISSTDERVEVLMELPEDAMDVIRKDEGSFKDNLKLNLSILLKRKDKP